MNDCGVGERPFDRHGKFLQLVLADCGEIDHVVTRDAEQTLGRKNADDGAREILLKRQCCKGGDINTVKVGVEPPFGFVGRVVPQLLVLERR